MQRQIPARASRFRPDAVTESIPISEDALYRVRTNTSVRRYNSGLPISTKVTEERTSGNSIASFSFWMTALGLILLAMVFAIMIVSWVIPALQTWHDNSTYGFPRTTHARKDVGHGGISDFTGININGYLYVIEIEEGDPTKITPHAYFLVHVSSNLTPIISMTFSDENNDGKLDMIVQTEDGTIFTFYNDGKQFNKQ